MCVPSRPRTHLRSSACLPAGLASGGPAPARRPRARAWRAPRAGSGHGSGGDLPPEQYRAYAEEVVDALYEVDPACPLPTLLDALGPGAEWVTAAAWGVGRHYVLLLDEPTGAVLAWAWLEEEAEWWTLQNIWVTQASRSAGLGRYLMRYIESATQYPGLRRQVAGDLRLTALGPAEGFYEKLGYPRLAGCVFSKEVPSTLEEFGEVHASSRLFQPVQADGFRLHIVPMHSANLLERS
ncbi:unnamed protein product [Prorocentrum cordatum]|uniref:N-acetyltransferase domain-containing protein n=1 Tax=Prorocentrum cordatum TaxID=2364126 RepID=A0ABN9UHU4_9DINO|nr:unnamed protein product [Polarella glacialis]